MVYKITILLFIFLFLSCKNSSEKSDLEIYNQNSTNLINQILTDMEIDCSCLLEPTHQSILEFMADQTPIRDNKKDLLEALELTNDSIFEKQNKLTQLFRIGKLNLNTNMTFLKRAEFNSIFETNKSEKARKILWNKCPSGILTLSPPIFNENYNIAVISVNGCFSGGSLDIYNLNNGKWILDKVISVSI